MLRKLIWMGAHPHTLLVSDESAEALSIQRLLASNPKLSGREAFHLLEQFDVSPPERRFVAALLRAKPDYRVFRCNQNSFCGDFVIVDMSKPASERPVYVIEIEARELGRRGDGVQITHWREVGALGSAHWREAAGVSLAHWRAAIDEIARSHGMIRSDVEPELIRGGEDEILAHLGVD